jgi:hypothetical protein
VNRTSPRASVVQTMNVNIVLGQIRTLCAYDYPQLPNAKIDENVQSLALPFYQLSDWKTVTNTINSSCAQNDIVVKGP